MSKRRHRRKRPRSGPTLIARGRSQRATQGVVQLGNLSLPCAFGRSGRRVLKREGDGATPIGTWRLKGIFYRSDRGPRPSAGLPIRTLRPRDGWCDAPADPNYNRQISHPYSASAEHLWRGDALYDIVVVLDHNDRPRRRGGGSAIFLHVARPGYQPTEGCIAFSDRDLRRLLVMAKRGTTLRVPA